MIQTSIWEKESFFSTKDVIIVGSGLVGLWSAYHLKKENPKLSVAVVDRGIIPAGASTRNAGFACFGSVTELLNDIRIMGEDNMLELVEMRYRGLKQIQKVFKSKAIDFEVCGGYELITEETKLSKKELKHEIERLNKSLSAFIKKGKTFRLADKKIKAFGFNGVTHLIENKLEGYLHSGKLCQALLQQIQAMGVTVLNAIEIAGYEKIGNQVVLYTNQHIHLSTRQLLICTNAFTKQLLPDADIIPARGQVLVTSEIAGLPFKGTFHFDEGYYYFRNLGNRILLGGARNLAFEEERTSEMMTTEKIQQELERFLKEVVLPHNNAPYTIEHRWSGIMGLGSEKMPIVKKVSDNVFCAVRMSGMGVALAPVVGGQVAKMMLR